MKTIIRLFLSVAVPLTSFPVPAAFAAADKTAPGKSEPAKTEAAQTAQETSLFRALKAALKDELKLPEKPEADAEKLAAWRQELKKAVAVQSKTPARSAGVGEGKTLAEQLSPFEKAYIDNRVEHSKGEDAVVVKWGKVQAIAVDKEKKDAVAFLGKFREIVWKDLDGYEPGKSKDELLLQQLRDVPLAAKDDKLLAQLGKKADELLAPPKPQEPEKPKGVACREDIRKVFTDPDSIECAVVEALIDKPNSPFKTGKLVNDEKSKLLIKGYLADYLSKGGYVGNDPKTRPQPPFLSALSSDFFRSRDLKDSNLDKFYCEWKYPGGMGGAPVDTSSEKNGSIKGDLKNMDKNSQAGAVADDIDKAKQKSGQTTDGTGVAAGGSDDPMFARCTNYYNENKRNRKPSDKDFDSAPEAPSRRITEPPLVVDAEPKEAEKKEGVPIHKLAIGAGVGAIGFGLVGFFLGGPVGAIMGAALGAAVMGGVAWLNNKYG